MTLFMIRIFFILGGTVLGFQIGSINNAGLIGAAFGFLAVSIIIFSEIGMRKVSMKGLSSAVFGLIFGILLAKLITDFIITPLNIGEEVSYYTRVILTLVFSYLCMTLAMRGRDEFNLVIPYIRLKRQDQMEDVVVLDTSSIIDGRIVDICKIKFIEAKVVVPRFVLKELQQIADSSDPIKRQRGRRGLEMLHTIQKDSQADIMIHEDDFPEVKEVDAKLIKLARLLDAKIFTMDFNLNKVAGLQGIKVLNINELSNVLKSVVFAGERMEIKLLREGKEYNQAVGYLEDGTMVVVDDAKQLIGQTINVAVTSVLQTPAGKMVFAKSINPASQTNRKKK